MREFAVQQRELVMDDKHKVEVGEASYPLAAAERGKQVIVGPNQVMAVGDYDFSKGLFKRTRLCIPYNIRLVYSTKSSAFEHLV